MIILEKICAEPRLDISDMMIVSRMNYTQEKR